MAQPDTTPAAGIPAAELEGRRERLLEQVRPLERADTSSSTSRTSSTSPASGSWRTNARSRSSQSASGESAIFVPEFEVARTREETAFERIESYPEYPGLEHPMTILGRAWPTSACRGRSRPTRMAIRGSSATRGRR